MGESKGKVFERPTRRPEPSSKVEKAEEEDEGKSGEVKEKYADSSQGHDRQSFVLQVVYMLSLYLSVYLSIFLSINLTI